MWKMRSHLMLLLLACGLVKSESDDNMAKMMDEVEELLRMDSAIDLKNATRLILLIGSSGVGKSTLAKFMTNDPSLQVFKVSRFNAIFRDNGTVSTNIRTSMTIVPNVYQDTETGTIVVDCPGFSDTRETKYEIANAFFIKKVLEYPKEVKLVVVENHHSVTAGSDRFGFSRLLTSLADLIPNIEHFNGSMSLVVTKPLRISDGKDQRWELDEFLNTYKEDLRNDTNSRTNATVQGMIRVLDVLTGPSNNVAFFWKPLGNNLISVENLLRETRTEIRSLVFDRMAWANNSDSVYRYVLSKESKLFVDFKLAPANFDYLANDLITFFGHLKEGVIHKIHNTTSKREAVALMKTLDSVLSSFNKTQLTSIGDISNITLRLGSCVEVVDLNATVVQHLASKADFFKEFGIDVVLRLSNLLNTEVAALQLWLSENLQNSQQMVRLEEVMQQQETEAREVLERTEKAAKEAQEQTEKELAEAKKTLDLNDQESVARLAAAEEAKKSAEEKALRASQDSKVMIEFLQQSIRESRESAERMARAFAEANKKSEQRPRSIWGAISDLFTG